VRVTILLLAAVSVAACQSRQPQPPCRGGRFFNSQRVVPRTLILSEIGEGGPTGVYAVRL